MTGRYNFRAYWGWKLPRGFTGNRETLQFIERHRGFPRGKENQGSKKNAADYEEENDLIQLSGENEKG